MSEYNEVTIEAAGELLIWVVRLRKQIDGMPAWCKDDLPDADVLDTLIKILAGK